MDFHYSESQEATRKLARDFSTHEVAPGAAQRDRTGQFDYALYSRLGELGITGMRFPEECGGTGFMDECPISRYYRDIRACTIADGTTEIQKWIIARELGC